MRIVSELIMIQQRFGEQKHCTVDSRFVFFLEALDVEDELKYDLHDFVISNMDWKQSPRRESCNVASADEV